jgi:hypothetical protein
LEKRSSNSDLLTLWIRLNLAILMNATAVEDNIRKSLRSFNPSTPVFTIKYFESL